MQSFKNVFELNDVVWFLLGLLIPAIISKVLHMVSHFRIIWALKKNDSFYDENFETESIQPLTHAAPYYKKENLRLSIPEDEFHISIPAEIHKQILINNPKFDNVDWETADSFFGNQGLSELYRYLSNIAKIPTTKAEQYVLQCRRKVAELFLQRSNEPFFNGEMYGIKSISENRLTSTEEPSVEIISFKSDYYTHRVMAKLYQELIKDNLLSIPRNIKEINALYPFLTSIGMDVILIIEKKQIVVLTKRSEGLINMQNDQWHLSMNEAISITDLAGDRIILNQCVQRGLHEELGIEQEKYDMRIDYGDLFFLKDPLEVGITGFVSVDGLSFEDLKSCYSVAKDSTFESTGNPRTGLKALSFSRNAIKHFYKETGEGITPACKFVLNMLLFRTIADKTLNNNK